MNRPRLFPMALVATMFLALAGSATGLAARQADQQKPAGESGQKQSMPGMDMDHDSPGMKMGPAVDEKNQQAEHGAMNAMSHMHHHQMGPHMYMTKLRGPASPADVASAHEMPTR